MPCGFPFSSFLLPQSCLVGDSHSLFKAKKYKSVVGSILYAFLALNTLSFEHIGLVVENIKNLENEERKGGERGSMAIADHG